MTSQVSKLYISTITEKRLDYKSTVKFRNQHKSVFPGTFIKKIYRNLLVFNIKPSKLNSELLRIPSVPEFNFPSETVALASRDYFPLQFLYHPVRPYRNIKPLILFSHRISYLKFKSTPKFSGECARIERPMRLFIYLVFIDRFAPGS